MTNVSFAGLKIDRRAPITSDESSETFNGDLNGTAVTVRIWDKQSTGSGRCAVG